MSTFGNSAVSSPSYVSVLPSFISIWGAWMCVLVCGLGMILGTSFLFFSLVALTCSPPYNTSSHCRSPQWRETDGGCFLSFPLYFLAVNLNEGALWSCCVVLYRYEVCCFVRGLIQTSKICLVIFMYKVSLLLSVRFKCIQLLHFFTLNTLNRKPLHVHSANYPKE